MGCGSSQSVSVINATEEKKLKNERIKNNDQINIEDLNTNTSNFNKINEPNLAKKSSNINNQQEKIDNASTNSLKSGSFNNKNKTEIFDLSTFYVKKETEFGKERKIINFRSNNNKNDSDDNENGMINYNESDSDDDSHQSCDYLDENYSNVITEKSDSALIQKVEQEFLSRNTNLDLLITGKSCPQLLTKKEKEKIDKNEETKTFEMLKTNGLVQLPVAMKQNYATFEIVEERLLNRNNTNNNGLIPPSRLAKREKSPLKLTANDIEQKIEKANQRKIERLKVKSLNSSISLDKKQTNHNDNYGDSEQVQRFNSSDVIERQKRLQEIRDKLKAKDAASAQVTTPRSKELINELENFRPKTSHNFRPDF